MRLTIKLVQDAPSARLAAEAMQEHAARLQAGSTQDAATLAEHLPPVMQDLLPHSVFRGLLTALLALQQVLGWPARANASL